MDRHESKGQPESIPYAKIVAAYGNRECPKLVEQAAGDDLQVRVNALAVICDEFRNPYKIFGCAQSGAIKVLSCMVIDPDEITRERASKALSIAAKDACGLEAILDDDAVIDMLNGINDPSITVRGNVYECICEVTRTVAGIKACVAAGVTHAFVQAVTREIDALKPHLLKALHNIASSPQGSEDALASGAVSVCAALLTSAHPETVVNAARTLGFLCSHESGKEEALYYDGTFSNNQAVRSEIKLYFVSLLTSSLFCSVYCFVLFCSVMFCSVLFCFVLFCSVLLIINHQKNIAFLSILI